MMTLPEAYVQVLRECSCNDTSFQRLVILFESAFASRLNQKFDAGETEHIEETLPEKYAKLEHFFAVSLDLWAVASMDGIILELNQIWETALGYAIDDLIGHSVMEYVHPDDAQPTIDAISQLRGQKLLLNFLHRFRAKDGSYRYIEWRSQPAGELIYASGRDVTERIELERQQARYKAIVTTMIEGIALQATDGSIQTCNAAAERILGLSVEQMTGVTSIDPRWRAIHEDLSPFPGETHPAMVALATGRPVHDVVMGVHKPNGTLTWILINSQPLFQNGEAEPSGVVTSFADITHIRRMEMALQQSEARLRSIVESIEDAVWSADLPSRKVTYMSPAVQRISGWSSEDFYENDQLRFDIIHPDDREHAKNGYQRIMQHGHYDWEYRIIRPDQRIRWIQTRASLVRNEQGVPVRMEGILTDITERKLLQQQTMELDLERERVKLLSNFITNTSHELRTPLATISTGLYLLTRIEDPQKRQAKAADMGLEVQYINATINQLHEMAKLDSLQTRETASIDLNKLVRKLVSQYNPQKRRVELNDSLYSQPLVIDGDVDYIQLALLHLVENAVRFSADGGRITVGTRLENNQALIEVIDQGEGIPAEHIARIFEHFYKVDAARTRDGSGAGMGLALVRRIMQLHGGWVAVQSEPGQGSIFTLYFPLTIQKEGLMTTEPETETAQGQFVQANGLNIYYEDHGQGTPLLLIHGGVLTSESWQPYLPDFTKHFRVITPDTRGHGRTANPIGAMNFRALANDMAALIQALGLQKPFVCGYSDGGQVALELGMRYPELAQAIIIGGAYPELTEASRVWVRSILGDPQSPEVDVDQFERDNPDFAAMLEGTQKHGNWKALLKQIKPMWNATLNYTPADFALVTAPTLVILGDRDDFVSVEEGIEMFRLLPTAELAVISDADHGKLISSPEKIALLQPIMVDFLLRHSPPADSASDS